MAPIKRALGRRAAKSAAKHTAHGTTSKLKRDPVRAATLLGLGAAAGILAGWAIVRAGTPTPTVSGP